MVGGFNIFGFPEQWKAGLSSALTNHVCGMVVISVLGGVHQEASIRRRGFTRKLRSVEHRGRGFVYPERLDGGKDLLLVAGEGHPRPKQVSMETESTDSGQERGERDKGGGGESYSVLRWETTSRLVNPACRKSCS